MIPSNPRYSTQPQAQDRGSLHVLSPSLTLVCGKLLIPRRDDTLTIEKKLLGTIGENKTPMLVPCVSDEEVDRPQYSTEQYAQSVYSGSDQIGIRTIAPKQKFPRDNRPPEKLD